MISICAILIAGCLPMKEAATYDAQLSITSENGRLPNRQINEEKPSKLTPGVLYAILIGEMALHRGQFDLAADAYTQAAIITKDIQVAEIASKLSFLANDYKKVKLTSLLWLKKDPKNSKALQLLAISQLRTNNIDGASNAFIQLIKLNHQKHIKENIEAVIALLNRESNHTSVYKTMANILTEWPEDKTALFGYASFALKNNQFAQAEQGINTLLAANPDWPKAVILKAHILLKNNQPQQAIEILQKALLKNPNKYLLRASLARIYLEEKKYALAKTEFLEVLKLHPYNTEVWYALALLSLQSKEFDQAKGYFTRLYSLDSRKSESAYYLGQIEETLKHSQQAIDWYNRVASKEYFLDAQLRVVALIAEKDGLEKTREKLDELRWKFPEEGIRFYLVEGELLYQQKKENDAMQLYNKAILEHPKNNKLLYARALLGQAMGFIDILERDLKKVISTEPNNVDALNALGYTLADETNRYNEAHQYIKRAFKLKPEMPAIIDSLGWVNYKLGHYKIALDHLKKAYDKFKDAEIAAHLGEVLWISGNRTDAKTIWDGAIKQDPDNPYLSKTIKRLTEKTAGLNSNITRKTKSEKEKMQ